MKVKRKRAILVVMSLIILIALAFVASQGYDAQPRPTEIVGKNTFKQTMVEADGSVAHFYATGDQYFNYLHDENGYILLRDNGYLVYATNRNGRPTPTPIRYKDHRQKILALQKMTVSDIDFAKNPDLITSYPENSASTLYQSASSSKPIVNFVIFISFAGENININKNYIDSVMSGPTNSLTDYYQQLSYGEILVHNIYPIKNGEIFVYQDSQPRSYYQLKRNSSSRLVRERTLLNNAVRAAREYFDFEGLDIDITEDGYVDAVNFLISGSPYSEWGGMLWPHSWDLDEISNGAPATIGNKKVKKYSFNFLEQLTVGLLAHEFAHVLGVPDLYHYEDNWASVGDWDLMHWEGDIPQFMITHLRHKYLNVLGENQIETIEFNGIYRLSPVTTTSKNQVLAYRINTQRPDEYFMVEYRNNNVTSYDSTLPGSGLIVYRVKQGVYGNSEALKNRASNPDEVYIFRPNAVTVGSDSVRSRANLNKAYLSPQNPDFSSVGVSLEQKPSSSYDDTTLFYTNGQNSGVIITALAINDQQITFEVRLSGDNNIHDDYFKDKLSLNNVKLNNDQVFSGVYAKLEVIQDFNISFLNDLIIKLKSDNNHQIASIRLDRAKFVQSYNNGFRSFDVRFVINHKGSGFLSSVFYESAWQSFEEPCDMELYAVDSDNDYIYLRKYSIDNSQTTWQSIEMTNINYTTSVEASINATIAVRDDGKAFVSSNISELNGLVLQDVLSASAGVQHILYIKSNLKVAAAGNFQSGENNINSWENIIKVAAGDRVSFGLTLNGQVVSAGRMDLDKVSGWTNIVDIAVGKEHIAALKKDGTVDIAGENLNQDGFSSWRNIIQITCGDQFTAGLTRDGKVVVTGELNDKAQTEGWEDITKIYAGTKHLLGLTKSGRVLAVGNNAFGQLNTALFFDIIDIAAGERHSVALREDGKLLYAGDNQNQTNNIQDNIIYYQDNYVEVSSLIAPFTRRVLKEDDTYQLEVGVFPANASYRKISYSSNNEIVVSVTPDGFMTAHNEGIATITAKHRGSDLEVIMVVEVIQHINTNSMIAAGNNHSVILNNKGTVYAMGDNFEGQTGVELWGNIVYIAAGGDTTVGVTPDGEVLVAGSMADSNAINWTDIAYVATSGRTIVGIKYDGGTVAVGDNQYNQTGFFNSQSGVYQVATSRTHTVAIYKNGLLDAKGLNDRGQCNVQDWRHIVKIVAKEGFTLGLDDSGRVHYAGQCAYVSDMSVISQWYDIVDIAASDEHIVAINSKGKAFAIGNNSFGQTDVEEFENVGMIAAGGQHTIAITKDGKIIGAGRNNDARLNLPSVNPLPFIELINAQAPQDTYGVKVGQTLRLDLRISPYNATDRKNITYSSSNPECVRVDENGFVTGVAAASQPVQIQIRVFDSQTQQQRILDTVNVYAYETASNITLSANPRKSVYTYQEKLDLSGGRVRIYLVGGESFETDIVPEMVVNYYTATSQLGERQVEIAVDGVSNTVKFPISVFDMAISCELMNLSEIKRIYEYGDEIDLRYGYLKITRGFDGQSSFPLSQLFAEGHLEVIYNTHLLGSTIVTLKYTDPIADEAGFVKEHFVTYVIDVLDAVTNIEVVLDKVNFKYGEEIFGNGHLKVNMKSGSQIRQDIVDIDENYQPGIDSRVTILDYNKYKLGIQNIRIRYYNPDFDNVYEGQVTVNVLDEVEEVEITSMTLEDRAVVDINKSPDRSISVRVTFTGGAVIEVGFDGQNQFFENMILSFNKGVDEISEGEDTINMDIKVNHSNYVDYYSIYTVSDLPIFGISQIQSLEIVGGSTFPYASQTDLKIKIRMNNMDYNIEIDDVMLGIDNTSLNPQTASFTLMGFTAIKDVSFYDYELEIYTHIQNVTALYGQDPDITVYAVMASGVESIVQDWFFVDFNNKQEGLQLVQIRYKELSCNIWVEVLDDIKEIFVFSSPKIFYEVNEPLDLSSFSIRLRFLSDELTDPIYFNYEEFTVEGFDNTVIGVQLVTITYKVTGDYWQYYFEVRNRIWRIHVDSEFSKSVYTVGEELDLTVVIIYINGDRDYITEGFQTNFNNTVPGEQPVYITYRGIYTTQFLVKVIDAPREISIKPPNKTHYQYGEKLDLDGGRVTIITQTGERTIVALSEYANDLRGFNSTPTKNGSQIILLSLSQFRVSASFKIYFAEKADSNILIAKGDADTIRIDRLNARIILEESATLSQFKNMVETYADIRFLSDEEYIDYELNQERYLSSAIKVQVVNYENTVLETFSVYLKGDANGNGVFDINDIPILADHLLAGLEYSALYGDITGDKRYTLTDFIKWVEKLEEELLEQEEDSQ